MLVGLSACATRETPRIVNTACLNFRALSYAVPSATKPETAENRFDTVQTVADLQEHNAKWDALCRR